MTIIEEIRPEERAEFAAAEWAKFNARFGRTSQDFAKREVYLAAKIPSDGEEEIVGYAHLVMSRGVCYIETQLIGEDYRREGHGKRLDLAITMRAREEGCHKIWLKTYANFEEAAAFWPSVGYELKWEEPDFEFGQTVLFFTKSLR